MNRSRTPLGKGLAIALTALLLAGGCQRANESANASGDEAGHRFSFIRAKQILARLDSKTGQVWFSHISGDGGFVPLGGTPSAENRPSVPGRFVLYTLNAGRGAPRREEAPSLLRVDRATGYTWIIEVQDGADWIAISEPDGTTPSAPVAPPTATRAASASDSAVSRLSAAGDDVALRVVPRDVIQSSPGEEEEKLQIVIDALAKEDLPVEIQAWAAAQLAEMDPDRAVPPLLKALESKHPEVVIAAINALQRTGNASTIPKILQLKQHPDARVRATVDRVVKPVR